MDRPEKKHKTELSGTYKLKLVESDANLPKPVLVTFPQNIPERKDDTSFEMLRKRRASTIRSVDSSIQMMGKYNPHLDSSKYLLGFVDEEKGRIDLVEIDQCYPVYRYLENDNFGELVGLNSNAQGMEFREMVQQELGTKKGRKILQQAKNKIIKEDAIFSASDIKEKMAQKADEIQHDIDQNNTTYFQKELERKKEFLPEFNLSSKSAAKIYNQDSLMPPQEASKLNLSVLDNAKALTQYTQNLKDNIKWDTLTEDQANHKRKLLVYLNHLMQFYRLRKIDIPIAELANTQKAAIEIVKGIVDRFYEPHKKESSTGQPDVMFVRSKSLETKLICHILILCLTLQGYKISLPPLTAALRMEQDRLSLLAREVGCTVDSQSSARLKRLVVNQVDKFQKPTRN